MTTLSPLEQKMLFDTLNRIEARVDSSEKKLENRIEKLERSFENKLSAVATQLEHLDVCLDGSKDIQRATNLSIAEIAKAFPDGDFARHRQSHINDEDLQKFIKTTKRNLIVEVVKAVMFAAMGAVPATFVLLKTLS